MTDLETDPGRKLNQQQISDYAQLTKSIFPEEIGASLADANREADGEGSGLAIGQTAPQDVSSQAIPPSSDFQHEIVALAHDIIRRDGLVLPSRQATTSEYSSEGLPAKYPTIPIDKETEHAMIWRTTESAAEALDLTGSKARRAMLHTPTTYDNDLEPILPPALGREVTEWMNRVLMNMAAARPGFAKDISTGLGSSSHEDEPKPRSPASASMDWHDVLAALTVDGESAADRELNIRIAHRVNARLATDAERRIDLTGADSGPDREDLQISTLLSRQAVLEQSLKRRQALEASLYDEQEGYDNGGEVARKRNKSSANVKHA